MSQLQKTHEHTSKQKIVRGRVKECQRCSLHEMGEGPVPASYGRRQGGIMIIGEAPGQKEDKDGVPFVGQAGKLLREVLHELGVREKWVSYCNVVSCRPDNNRNPDKREIGACSVNMRMQIGAVSPHIIVPLGAIALARFREDMKISWDRGKPFVDMKKRYVILPTFHPAYVLRQKSTMELFRGDLRQAKTRFELYAKKGFMEATLDWPEECRHPNCKEDLHAYDKQGVGYCEGHWNPNADRRTVDELTLKGTV